MSAPITIPSFAWTCHACQHLGALESFYDTKTRTYACPSCREKPKIPAIQVTQPQSLETYAFFTPTPKQVEAMLCPIRNLLYGGRAGSGKSHWLRNEAYLRCMLVPGYRCLLLRRQWTELRDTHIDKAAVEAGTLGATWRASENTVVFNNGSRLRFGHCENDDAVRLYLSSEFDWIGFDEGATFTEYSVRFIGSRLRTTKPGVIPMIRIGSNPGAMWLYRYYIAKDVDTSVQGDPSYRPEDYHFIPATVQDNPHVNLAEQELRLNMLPSEALRKMYRDGDWTAVEGQMFEEFRARTIDGETLTFQPWHEIDALPTIWDPASQTHVPIDECPWVPITRVLDWGYDPDPGVCTWFAHLPDNRYIALQEYVFRKTLAKDVADEVKSRSAGMKIRQSIGGHDMWMKNNQTGESLAETFARHGVSWTQAATDRIHGWQRTHALLQETVDDGTGALPRFQIYAPGCPTLARTLPMLQNDPKVPGDCLQKEDHAPDTLRWFAMARPTAGKTPGKPTAWSRLSAEAKSRILRGSQTVLGSSSVRRRR